MRGGLVLLGTALMSAAIVMACPPSMRADVADRANVPDHVVEAAERQLAAFVSWARNETERPALSQDTEFDV
jgi:hypothetical protein